jgi:hypothetical protein
MTESVWSSIPGGQALIEWFGRVPHFHDAQLREINLVGDGLTTLGIRTWQITEKIDEQGYFILDKHVAVTIVLEGVTHIELRRFNLPGIIHKLGVASVNDGFQLDWTASYGVEGVLRAEQLRIEFAPGG